MTLFPEGEGTILIPAEWIVLIPRLEAFQDCSASAFRNAVLGRVLREPQDERYWQAPFNRANAVSKLRADR
jgi:hypothetical protein